MPEEKKEEKKPKEEKTAKKEHQEVMKTPPPAMASAPLSTSPQTSSSAPWMLATIILLIIAIILAVLLAKNYNPSKTIEKDIAAPEVASLIKDTFGVDLELDTVEEKEDLYEMNFKFAGRKFLIYTTKDLSFIRLPNGNWIRKAELSPEGGNTTKTSAETETSPGKDTSAQEINIGTNVAVTPSAKPKVELFVMSLCPYALQAEKGILPVVDLLKEKIDFKIRFMHYILKGTQEEQENNRQVCVREEQSAKFSSYLKCFLDSGKSADCIKTSRVDTAKLDTCIKNKASQYYLNDSKLSKSYGIESSPTLIINGNKESFFPRDPSTALETICSAFTTKPAECSQDLSKENPSAAFGSGEDKEKIEGSCG